MLNVSKVYVQSLVVEGLLDEKLGILLNDLLMSRSSKSFDNSLQTRIPRTRDVISAHPLLKILPYEVRRTLEGSMKEEIKPREMILCKEGSMPQCLLLVQNGLLKISNSTRSMTRTTLAEECVLGLYEILSGKPCICDINTDTMVLCYAIETKTLLPLAASDPIIENLFWQECVLVLAKVLLPEVIDKIPMQGVRALIGERFSMTTYVGRETIVIPENITVFLLEGVLRNQELPGVVVEPPAVLLASYGSSGSSTSEISAPPRFGFCHYGYRYQVETIARIAYVDTSEWSPGGSALSLMYEERNATLAQLTTTDM